MSRKSGCTDNTIKNHWNSTMKSKIFEFAKLLDYILKGDDLPMQTSNTHIAKVESRFLHSLMINRALPKSCLSLADC
jgi:hypothetical protein